MDVFDIPSRTEATISDLIISAIRKQMDVIAGGISFVNNPVKEPVGAGANPDEGRYRFAVCEIVGPLGRRRLHSRAEAEQARDKFFDLVPSLRETSSVDIIEPFSIVPDLSVFFTVPPEPFRDMLGKLGLLEKLADIQEDGNVKLGEAQMALDAVTAGLKDVLDEGVSVRSIKIMRIMGCHKAEIVFDPMDWLPSLSKPEFFDALGLPSAACCSHTSFDVLNGKSWVEAKALEISGAKGVDFLSTRLEKLIEDFGQRPTRRCKSTVWDRAGERLDSEIRGWDAHRGALSLRQ